MSEAGLDQLVKGSPPPNVSLPSVAAAAASTSEARSSSRVPSPSPSDPTSLLPSSPPQIYLNLLILEASLRAQYLTLRARRRQHTFILSVLLLWIAYFFYGQFLRPREDGTGMGGSVYWLVDMVEKIFLIGGLVMGVLFRLTGQWERGVRWPSRWLRTTNRGLRGMNCKIVVLKGPWWSEFMSYFGYLFPLSWFVETPGSYYRYIEYASNSQHERRPSQLSTRSGKREKHHPLHETAEEDIAPGGDYIKILLLPKHFTPEFRENWEIYRADYWETENMRRAELRAKIRAQQKQEAKAQSPWLWWLPLQTTISGSFAFPTRVAMKHAPLADGNNPPSRNSSQRHHPSKRGSIIKVERASLPNDRETHSRSSSRSSVSYSTTQTPEIGTGGFEDGRERRSSLSGAGTEAQRRRKKLSSQDGEKRLSGVGPTGRAKGPVVTSSRPSTPTDIPIPGQLKTKGSNLSAMSSGSDGDSPARRRAVDPMTSSKPKVKKEEMD
jgi:Spo7-like protein